MNLRACYICRAIHDADDDEHIEWHDRLRERLEGVSSASTDPVPGHRWCEKCQAYHPDGGECLAMAADDAGTDAPTVAEIAGSDPGFTGDKTTQEYLDDIRGSADVAVTASCFKHGEYNPNVGCLRCSTYPEPKADTDVETPHSHSGVGRCDTCGLDVAFEWTGERYELSRPESDAEAPAPGANAVWCGKPALHPPHEIVPGASWCAGSQGEPDVWEQAYAQGYRDAQEVSSASDKAFSWASDEADRLHALLRDAYDILDAHSQNFPLGHRGQDVLKKLRAELATDKATAVTDGQS